MLKKLLALSCLALSIAANSATLLVSGGQLTGATGVDVGGVLYDVTIINGTCNELYSGCTTFAFSNDTEAWNAGNALLEQVFLGDYDADASLTRGIDDPPPAILDPPWYGISLVPYGRTPAGLLSAVSVWNYDGAHSNDFTEVIELSSGWETVETGERWGIVWTQWTPSAVPLPAAAWLFGSALLGLGALKRKKLKV